MATGETTFEKRIENSVSGSRHLYFREAHRPVVRNVVGKSEIEQQPDDGSRAMKHTHTHTPHLLIASCVCVRSRASVRVSVLKASVIAITSLTRKVHTGGAQ